MPMTGKVSCAGVVMPVSCGHGLKLCNHVKVF
jgi:hypothetical protein